MNDTTTKMWEFYTKKKMSLQEVAEHFGISRQAVSKRFKRSGLSCRSTWAQYSMISTDTKQKIINLYTNLNQSGPKIARDLGLLMSTVYKVLHSNKIKPKACPKYFRKKEE